MHYGFGGFGGFGMILFWIALIAVIVFLIKVMTDSARSHKSGEKTPLEILNERYAAGKLNHDEYISRKKDLAEH